jgi:acyl dehydratase
VVLGAPPPFYVDPAVGLTPGQILHAEQGLVLHRALPSTATVTGVTRVTGLADKGHGRGALIYLERGVADSRTGERYATVTSTYYIRGGGGFGGQNEPAPPPHRLPDRLPDLQFDMPTMAQMALFYRLNGDLNPLHVDAAVAAEAGYPRPILHGLCTYAIAAHAVLRAVADDAPAAMQALQARFSAPVFPGETLAIRIWRDGAIVSFEASVKDRDVVVLTNGRAVMRRDS